MSELVKIRASEVDLDGCKIFIDNGIGSKDRYILFPTDFRLAFQAYIEAHPGSDFLFQSRLNQPFTPRRVQQIIRKYADKAGLTRSVHPSSIATPDARFLDLPGTQQRQNTAYLRPLKPKKP